MGSSGILVVDKPSGLTSAVVVARVKRALGADRAGHTGTLDPRATGVLPVCVGDATKLAEWLLADDKGYEAELVLGVQTTTLDADGAVTATAPVHVTEAELVAALAARIGPSLQVPPMYSAIKRGKKRLHQLARAGEVVERAPRPITIHALELIAFDAPRARIRVACSKGTYVRSLVDDLGRDLGCGAHLSALRRTRSGQFTIDQAVPIEAITPATPLVPLTDALPLRRVEVPADRVRAVLTAYQAAVAPLVDAVPEGELFQMVGPDRSLLAVGRRQGGALAFARVFGC